MVSLHPAQCCTGVKQEQEVSLQAGGAGGEGACEGAPAWQELGQEAGVRRSVVIPMCPSYNCYAFTDQ